jgi:hypothetical protein
MNWYTVFFVIVLLIIFIWIFLIFKFTKKYKINPEKIIFFKKQLKRIVTNWSYKEQIIDIDKLYHKVLQEAGYNGTFWEILKSEPSEIWNLQNIWELHKLRNKLVHDFDLLSENILKQKAIKYKDEINKLIKQIS